MEYINWCLKNWNLEQIMKFCSLERIIITNLEHLCFEKENTIFQLYKGYEQEKTFNWRHSDKCLFIIWWVSSNNINNKNGGKM